MSSPKQLELPFTAAASDFAALDAIADKHAASAPMYRMSGPKKPAVRVPTDDAERKAIPLDAVLDYFPDALLAIARVIEAGRQQHTPESEQAYWARNKSKNHASSLLKHFLDRGEIDVDKLPHSAKMSWRALAILQLEEEQRKGLPPSRGSR